MGSFVERAHLLTPVFVVALPLARRIASKAFSRLALVYVKLRRESLAKRRYKEELFRL